MNFTSSQLKLNPYLLYINIFEMGDLTYVKFAAYSLVGIFHGIILGALGPVIVYFSQVTHQDQTYFSFLFFAKAIGFIIGASLTKVLQPYISYHSLFVLSLASCGLALIISSLDFGFWNLSLTMIVVGAASCIFEILITLCVFELFFKNEEQYWLQFSTIFYALGGLIVPIITLWTEELTLRAVGILIFMCITPLLMLRSPQIKRHSSEVPELEEDNNLLELPLFAEMLICLLIFLIIGLIVSHPGWIPTFALKTEQFNQFEANLLVSIYWAMEIVGKIVQLFIKYSVRSKTYFYMRGLLLVGVITLILQWLKWYRVCCYFRTITSGYFLAPLYALVFTLPQEYGYKYSVSATANITLASVIAEGILIAPIGYLMGEFGFHALMYSTFVLLLIMYFSFSYFDSYLKQDSDAKKDLLSIHA